MNGSVKKLLSGLISLLNDPNIKGKQAAFDACYEQITKAKNLSTWETIVEIIKDESGANIDARTASNMYGRSKRKLNNKIAPSIITTEKNINEENKKLTKEAPIDKSKKITPADLKKIRSEHIDLESLKNGE